MRQCIIFCAAGFDGLIQPIPEDALVIAADGGYRHTQALGITPDIVLGDFDSLGFVPEGAQVFPVEKDDTDAMLAVKLGLERGCGEFLLYGSLDGERLDHTMANYQTLQYLAQRGARGTLAGKNFLATVIRNGTLAFPADCRGHISVFCLGADAENITIRGLKYSLENGRLSAGFPLGVSNHFMGCESQISVGCGSLLVLWQRQEAARELSF